MDRDGLLERLLLKMADRSNSRAERRGAEPVGQRRIIPYSNPRFMGGDPVYEDVYKTEQILRNLADRQSNKKPRVSVRKAKKRYNKVTRIKPQMKMSGGGSWRDDKRCVGKGCGRGSSISAMPRR